jgi:hypothetical protein
MKQSVVLGGSSGPADGIGYRAGVGSSSGSGHIL